MTSKPGTVRSLVLLALALGMPGCSKRAEPEKTATPVRVDIVKEHAGDEAIRYSASIEADQQVPVSFKLNGYVRQFRQVRGTDGHMRHVQAGDRVSRGTVLAWLRDAEFTSRVDQARSQVAQAQANAQKAALDFERASNLFNSQSMTKSDLDAARAQHESAQARVEGARAQLSEAEISLSDASLRAPFDGVILKREIELGELVGPGTVGFVLADVSNVKAIIGVPDVAIASMKPGAPLTVTAEALPGMDFRGRITRVSPAADSKSRVFEVEITIPNPKQLLKVGMIASLPISEPGPSAQPVTVVPLAAVVRAKTGGEDYAVFVIEPGQGKRIARSRTVKLGEAYGNTVAVLEGVKVGEQVITTGASLLHDGDAVVLIP